MKTSSPFSLFDVDMSHRIFVGLHISESTGKEVMKWSEQWKRSIPARWIPAHNLHITLLPPWEEDDIDGVKEKLKTIGKDIGLLQLEFHSVLYGPDPRKPRLIWAEGKTPEKLLVLKKQIERSFPNAAEHRPFLLHLTIARFHENDFRSFPVKMLHELIAWKDHFTSFTLFESHLLRSGAQYEVLGNYPL